jgi:hypothetical protein
MNTSIGWSAGGSDLAHAARNTEVDLSGVLLCSRDESGATSVPLAEQAVYVARSLGALIGRNGLVVLVILALSISVAHAQSGRPTFDAGVPIRSEPNRLLAPLNAQGGSLIGDVEGRTFLPPAEQLKLQVEWVAKVGGLEPAETELLFERGAQAIEKRGGLFLQGGKIDQRAFRRWQIFDNRVQLTSNIPAEPPSRAIRRTLMPLLKELSPQAAARVRAERDRLDSWRGQASLLAQVAVLDECLLLSDEQRTRFCASLAEATSDAWWRATSPGAMLDTSTHQLLTLLAEGGLGEFIVPEADLARLLRPSQMAAFKKLRGPVHEEILLSENVPPALVAAALEKQAAAVAKTPRAERPAVRSGLNIETEEQRLGRAMEEWVDDIDAACQLTASQREKLILAGKLDIERVRQPTVVPDKPAAHEIVVQTIRLRAGVDVMPLAIFCDEASHFQKALQSVLVGEQREKLVQSRRDFQRRALVEAVVVGFECSAALTAQQCEELSRVLNGTLADEDLSGTTDWRLECVRRIVDLPLEKIGHVLFDFQLDAARRHQQRLAEAGRQFSPSAPMGIIQAVRDKNGTVLQTRLLHDGTPEGAQK